MSQKSYPLINITDPANSLSEDLNLNDKKIKSKAMELYTHLAYTLQGIIEVVQI